MSAGLLEEDLALSTVTDDPAAAAHIVFVPKELRAEGVTPQALVLQARVEGHEVTALCGYTWVPRRDPAPLPVCSECLAVYEAAGHDGVPDA